MKITELRIGNYVNRLGNPTTILGIQQSEKIGYVSTPLSGAVTINQIEPTLLTEEWLLKFGFKQGDNKSKSDCFYEIPVGGSGFFINPNNGVVWIERGSNIFNNPALIEYVHQLQNIYFALTGEELQIHGTDARALDAR